VLCARSGCLPCASPYTCYTTDLICLGKVFCILVLKLSNVLCTLSVITHVRLERSLPYLVATATSMNLTNYSGVMLSVIVDAVAIAVVVVTVGSVFLITLVGVFWKHVSFLLLAVAISSWSSLLSALPWAAPPSPHRLCCVARSPYG
jgi:hypothetical protein